MASKTDEAKLLSMPLEQVREHIEDELGRLANLAGAAGQRYLASSIQTAALEAARRPEAVRR